MELSKIIQGRRSVHTFADRPVWPSLITDLLDVAVWAPNHHVTEPWRFLVVVDDGRRAIASVWRDYVAEHTVTDDPAVRAQRAANAYETALRVPCFVFVIMRNDPHPVVRQEDYAATCCVVQNFHLLAWEWHLGVTWKSYLWPEGDRFREDYGIAMDETVAATLLVGYPAQVPRPQPRTPARERVTVLDQEMALR